MLSRARGKSRATLLVLMAIAAIGTSAAAASSTAPVKSAAVEAAFEPPDEGFIIEKLRGLVLLGDPSHVAPQGLPDVKGVDVREVPLMEQGGIKKKLAGYLGKPLTKRSKAAILADIVRFFRRQGHPLVDVSTPPQEVTGGVLQVLVVEGLVGRIRVEGDRWFTAGSVSQQIRARSGSTLDFGMLSEDMDWINRNPFRTVDLVYVKSADLGKTDLVLRQVDRFPLRVYTGYEDSGTPLTGDNRWLGGFNWGNVFGLEGAFNYQFVANPADFNLFRAHAVSFLQPLPWRHTLTLFYSRADTQADLPSPFKLGGFSWQIGARYEAPLPRLGAYKHAVTAGLDFKRADSALAFGGIPVFGTTTEIVEYSLGYDSSFNDRFGRTTFRATGYWSPGTVTGQNTTAAFQQARAGAKADYTYGKLELNRTTTLPFDFLLVNLFTYQQSDANLLPSEQIGFGGYDTIRGYDTRVVNTDDGYIISNELRTPSVSLFSWFSALGLKKASGVGDKLQFIGFADYGVGGNRDLLAGEKAWTVLFGAGPGLRYTIAPYLSVRADYGWQLRNAEANRRAASRWHVGATASF